MDAALTEEPAISPTESELPDMVPVSIRSTVPEVQHHSLQKVLAGLLLTWQEFLCLFDIRLDPDQYIIRGANGTKSKLDQKIGDYVNSLKRRMKTYPVTLERIKGTNDIIQSQRLSTNSEEILVSVLKIEHKMDPMVDEQESTPSSSMPKKLKLIDSDKRLKNHRKPRESLEKIAQSVIQPSSQKRFNTSAIKSAKKLKSNSRSPTPEKDVDEVDQSNDGGSSPSELVVLKASSSTIVKRSLKRRTSDHFRIRDSTSSRASKKPAKRNRKSRSTVSRESTQESYSGNDSSETDDDEVPCTKEKRKLLKQNVIEYLQEKVSPRSMLRLRNELMSLREAEKYFKVTSVVPMTAGMMEQTFCRKMSN